MKQNHQTRISAVAVAVAVALTGCATSKPGAEGTASTSSNDCGGGTVVAGAVVGAIVGGLIAAATKNKAGQGAAIGAAVGGGATAAYCFAFKSEAKQTKTAAQVENEYRQQTRGVLPDTPVVRNYSTSINPANGAVSKGGQLVIVSNAEVVNGANQRVEKVEEEIKLSRGKENFGTMKKEMPGKGGGYQVNTTINVPDKFQDGAYALESRVLINGQPAGDWKQSRVQVVKVGGQIHIAMNDTAY